MKKLALLIVSVVLSGLVAPRFVLAQTTPLSNITNPTADTILNLSPSSPSPSCSPSPNCYLSLSGNGGGPGDDALHLGVLGYGTSGGKGGTFTQYSLPTVLNIAVNAATGTDMAPLCMTDNNLTGQLECSVLKSNGQTEWVFGNWGCMGDLQVNAGGDVVALGPVGTSSWGCDTDLTTQNGNIHLTPGTAGNKIFLDAPAIATGNILDGQTATFFNSATGCALGSASGCGAYDKTDVFNNPVHAADASTFTLPTAVAGKKYCSTNIMSQAAGTPPATGTITFQPVGTDKIIYAGFLSHAGNAGGYVVSNGAFGDDACVEGVEPGYWVLRAFSGTWTLH